MSIKNSHIICLLAIALLCFTTTMVVGQGALVVSDSCGFSARFPAEPNVDVTQTPTDYGLVRSTAFIHEIKDKLAFHVMCIQYPPNYTLQNDPELMLNNAKKSITRALDLRKFEEESSIDLDGYPGLKFKATSGFYYVNYNIYIVDGKVFQIAVMQYGSYADAAKTKTFLESFRLLEDTTTNTALKVRDIDSILAEESALFTATDSSFQINFPRPPLADTALVKTDVGEVNMFSFKVDQGNQVLTVAFSDFPTALVELSDPKELLTGGKNSAMNSLELKTIEEEKEITLDGYPGIYFKGHSDKYYTIYKVYMVKNRLYQVAITKTGSYPALAEVRAFGDSFKLLR